MNLPFISICTPTFNRRPFFPALIRSIVAQDYPKSLIEWIVVDDGTDPIEDLVVDAIPDISICYYYYSSKMTLGAKRNLMNSKATGDILVYFDDDDYYPPTRIGHAVAVLQANPEIMCAGCNTLYIYFQERQQLMQFGPYGPNHSTAATFAFRKSLLEITSFQDNASVGEEKQFLKDYTIPLVQLDPVLTILVFSHSHNSCDRGSVLPTTARQMPTESNQRLSTQDYIREASLQIRDFIPSTDDGDAAFQFFMHDMSTLLEAYEPGQPKYKPDILEAFAAKRVAQEIKQRAGQTFNETRSPQDDTTELAKLRVKYDNQTHLLYGLLVELSQVKPRIQFFNEFLETSITDPTRRLLLQRTFNGTSWQHVDSNNITNLRATISEIALCMQLILTELNQFSTKSSSSTAKSSTEAASTNAAVGASLMRNFDK